MFVHLFETCFVPDFFLEGEVFALCAGPLRSMMNINFQCSRRISKQVGSACVMWQYFTFAVVVEPFFLSFSWLVEETFYFWVFNSTIQLSGNYPVWKTLLRCTQNKTIAPLALLNFLGRWKGCCATRCQTINACFVEISAACSSEVPEHRWSKETCQIGVPIQQEQGTRNR